MSKTLRKIIQGGFDTDSGAIVVVDDTKAKRQKRGDGGKEKKLKPYIKEDTPYKGRYKRGEHSAYSGGVFHKMGNTNAGAKLENDNANRSMKKGKRQLLKKELKAEIEQL